MQTGGRGGAEQRQHSRIYLFIYFLALMTSEKKFRKCWKTADIIPEKTLLSEAVPVVTAQKPANYSERKKGEGVL